MRFLVIALALSLTLSSVGVTGAAQTEAASMTGIATSSTGEILVNTTVQLRDLASGTVFARTTTSSTGAFSFTAINPGNYIVEVVNAASQIVGASASISVAAGAALTGVAVSATAAAVTAAAGAAGISTLVAVTTAAAAAGVVGIVAVGQGDASALR